MIKEPLGGAHRDYDQAADSIRRALAERLAALGELPVEDLVARRYQRLMSYGNVATEPADD